MLPPGAIFKLKIHQNAYAAWVSPRTPYWGKLQTRPPSWFSGSRFAAGEGKGEKKEEKEEKGRG